MKKFNTKTLTALSLLTAMEIILSRFCSVSAWNIKLSFGFLPVVISAVLFGPLPAAVVGALGDFIGALLFPIGPYFPGFTLTAFLTGLVFGLLLHRRRSAGRILAAVAVSQLALSLLLNSAWISLLYASPYLPLLSVRLVQCAVLAPVQFLTIAALTRVLGRLGKRALA
jgi:ECF transporter S component (folate family)